VYWYPAAHFDTSGFPSKTHDRCFCQGTDKHSLPVGTQEAIKVDTTSQCVSQEIDFNKPRIQCYLNLDNEET
jgi:hypothetical protein